MVDVARARKLAVRIREIAAATLEHQVKDPRLGLVTVTDARVTPDLREATVFYTVYGDDEARELSAAALRSATGVVRSAVGRQTGIKFTPTLTFVADVVPDNARLMEDLLAAARVQDELVAQAREGKVPVAGDDPYRHPRVDDDADGDVDRSGGDEDRRAVVDAGEQSGPA